MPRITFHGAAETVTGSKYLLEAEGTAILIDCGQFQGLKDLRSRNWEPFPFDPKKVSACVLSHAHIDHCGMLPRLNKLGYDGKVFCTPPTVDLLELTLFDAAKNQEQDADYANRKGFSKHHPAEPLFSAADVTRLLKQLKAVKQGDWTPLAGPFHLRFIDAGHLLGSSMVEIEIREGQGTTRVLFSGDVGRYGAPLYHDPSPPPDCDYLICESTYGDRDHADINLLDELESVVQAAMRRGGVMLVSSFAIGRAQQLIYLLQVLIHQDRLPELPIFLDSPMSVDATNIYKQHQAYHDLSESDLSNPKSLFRARNIHYARSTEESKRINDVPGPAVIIASSGMMVGGRILHHLKQRLPDARNTMLLGGFMSEGTRGRAMQDGAKFIRVHGRDIPVHAAVVRISGLSGHADRRELKRWLKPILKPRQVFITHGELASANAFATDLRRERGWHVVVPKMGESFELGATQ